MARVFSVSSSPSTTSSPAASSALSAGSVGLSTASRRLARGMGGQQVGDFGGEGAGAVGQPVALVEVEQVGAAALFAHQRVEPRLGTSPWR